VLERDNPFWKFSLAVYAQAGVASECLALQNALDIDVNALLFCVWLGAEKKLVLDDKNLGAIDACIQPWHRTAVRPLRGVRQAMKSMPEIANAAATELRQDIAAVELKAEQIEQALLFQSMDALSSGAATADDAETAIRANIAAFVRRHAPDAAKGPATPSLIGAALGRQSAAQIKNP
jgi:uncharacterized protein (TIGR02444 family)